MVANTSVLIKKVCQYFSVSKCNTVWGKNFVGLNFVGQNYLSGKIFFTKQKLRHFRLTKFSTNESKSVFNEPKKGTSHFDKL